MLSDVIGAPARLTVTASCADWRARIVRYGPPPTDGTPTHMVAECPLPERSAALCQKFCRPHFGALMATLMPQNGG
jgi:hypothetical protein